MRYKNCCMTILAALWIYARRSGDRCFRGLLKFGRVWLAAAIKKLPQKKFIEQKTSVGCLHP